VRQQANAKVPKKGTDTILEIFCDAKGFQLNTVLLNYDERAPLLQEGLKKVKGDPESGRG